MKDFAPFSPIPAGEERSPAAYEQRTTLATSLRDPPISQSTHGRNAEEVVTIAVVDEGPFVSHLE
jgi:hypothetical protein